MSLARSDMPDLTEARASLQSGRCTARQLMEVSLGSADLPEARGAYVRRFDTLARATAEGVDRNFAAGAPLPPLAGLAVSIKDLFDVAGACTTAGSKVLEDETVAHDDAPAVARLRAAGAALTGQTNMSEFAYSGVGLNPHHGTPANPATLLLDPTPRIPGGSTSGGGVTVAAGAAWAALGSDTGGSIRIPAALQGLVGFKNTQRLTPLEGAVPLSYTLDTSCAITRSVRDAVLLHEILSARKVVLRHRPLAALRLAVPRTLMLDDLEPVVATVFERCLSTLSAAGALIDEIDLEPLKHLAALQANGGFAAAESWSWHRHRLSARQADYDPRVAMRIRRGEAIGAADHIDLHLARRDWIARMQNFLDGYDAMLSPTVPMVAPPILPLVDDDAAFFATNGRLLRNPSAVNFLDGCALSLPCQQSGEMPVGLMVWAGAMCDDTVLDVCLGIEAELRRQVR